MVLLCSLTGQACGSMLSFALGGRPVTGRSVCDSNTQVLSLFRAAVVAATAHFVERKGLLVWAFALLCRTPGMIRQHPRLPCHD